MANERIIIARGEIEQADVEFIRRFLGRLGLSTEVIDIQALEELKREIASNMDLPYSIDEITKTDQYLVKEHFQQYRALHKAEVTSQLASMAFGILVNEEKWYSKKPSPEKYGIKLAERDEVGFPKIVNNVYQESSRIAVEVGSFLSAVDSRGNGLWPGLVSKRQTDFLVSVGAYLSPRVVHRENT